MYKPKESKLFAAALKQLLCEKNLSQRQFAKKAGLKTDYVSKLVNGVVAEPRQNNRRKIATGLEMTEQKLLEYIAQYRNSEAEKTISAPSGLAESKEAIANTSQESVDSKADSEENLMILAARILEQLGLNQKFQVNRTSQYIDYRLNDSEQYQLVLVQRNEDLYVSINKTVFQPYLLELKCEHDYVDEDGYDYPVITTLGFFLYCLVKNIVFCNQCKILTQVF